MGRKDRLIRPVNTDTKRHGLLLWADGPQRDNYPVPEEHAMDILREWGLK